VVFAPPSPLGVARRRSFLEPVDRAAGATLDHKHPAPERSGPLAVHRQTAQR